MKAHENTFNWRRLFAGNPEHVHVTTASDGRVFGTDRYSVWNLSAVCEAENLEVPAAGSYRATSKELRTLPVPTKNVPLNGDKIAALFDSYVEGIGPDHSDRLMVSEWSNGTYRPVVHCRTADVRMIGTQWDNIPRLGNGSYWVACANWGTVNVAVHWNMAKQIPFGAVQLIGSSNAPSTWTMEPYHMAKAVAIAESGADSAVIEKRYPW